MVHIEERDGSRWLRMESGKVQAFDLELTLDLCAALTGARDAGAPPLVLTGTGSSFSAGVDLFRVLRDGADYVAAFLPAFARLLTELFTYPGPLVTAVNGHAVAGGALVAWCGDQRVMAQGAGRIGVPELRVGVPFPAAAVEILRFASGGRGLQGLAYVGRTVSPDEALAAGLVDEIAPPESLEARAAALAGTLAAIPRASFSVTKHAIRRPYIEILEQSGGAIDGEVLRIWRDAATMDAIRGYLDRTFRRP